MNYLLFWLNPYQQNLAFAQNNPYGYYNPYGPQPPMMQQPVQQTQTQQQSNKHPQIIIRIVMMKQQMIQTMMEIRHIVI